MGRYSPSPVVMSSPHPQEECMRRLAAVTSMRGTLWYLDPKTARRPDPLLQGYVGKWSIQVYDWAESQNRHGYPSRLEAELHPAPDGGTKLTGQVGPGGQAQVSGYTAVVIAVIAPFVFLGVFITGLIQLSHGYIATAMPILLIPVAVGAVFWYFARIHRQTWWPARGDSSARLLRKVAGLLDATIDPPATAEAPDGPTAACPR